MKELRMKRLQKEVQERVLMNDGNLKKSFQDVLNHLYKEYELCFDNDRLVQSMEIHRDINMLKEMINKYNTLQGI
jgi:tellurite resistance protein